ncbi:MAG: hypothetical protein JSU04_03330 [Bdellovibrionales bacterium]|nr:hypothetical protein [Bdellovibrionales bacterium]
MSLVEAMVFLAIFAIALLVSLQWLQSVYLGNTRLNRNTSIDNAMAEVAIAFGTDDKYCNYILSSYGNNPNPDPELKLTMADPAGAEVSKIELHDENGTILGAVLSEGKPFDIKQNDLIVKSMRLKPIAAKDPLNIIAKLEFTFQKGTGTKISEATRWIPVNTTIDPVTGFVATCSIAGDSLMTLKSRNCEIGSDGYEHYDVSTDKCVLNANVFWHRSSMNPKQIQCPAGSRPAVSMFDMTPENTICHSDGGRGVILKARTYQSGYIWNSDDEISYIPSYDRATASCLFTYVAAANPNDFVPEIKCVGTP